MLDTNARPFALAVAVAGILLSGCTTEFELPASSSLRKADAGCDPDLDDCEEPTPAPRTGSKDAGIPRSVPVPKKMDAGLPRADAGGADAAVVVPLNPECASSATSDSCFACCDTKHPKGVTVSQQAFGDCNCLSPGTCKSACSASYCAGSPAAPGSACDTCLSNSAACGTVSDNACAADATCALFASCYTDSHCATKP